MMKRLLAPTLVGLVFCTGASVALAQEDPSQDPPSDTLQDDEPPPPADEDEDWPEYRGRPDGAEPSRERPTRRPRRRPPQRGPAPGYDRRYPSGGPHGYPSRYPEPSAPGYNYGGPRVIEDWEPGDPVPAGYRPDTQPFSGLVKAGAGTLFGMYGATVVAGSFLALAEDIDLDDGVDDNGIDPEDWYPLFIPVAGPFVTIATAGTERAGTTLLVLNGVVQVSGLAMFIAGFAAQRDVLVRIPTYNGMTVDVTPVVGKDFQGVGVHGSF